MPGILSPGALNSITDVGGVRVGHHTIISGDNIRTGVTAILPHGGNILHKKVPAAIYVGNGFGKLTGATQVNELGEIETPILLTNTLSVNRVADALVEYLLSLPENAHITSVNPIVAETNDAFLNDIRLRLVDRDDVIGALRNAKEGLMEEGSVGAGTGTVALGFKGGIGTSSRILPRDLGGYTVGVLVQTNFDGVLAINGAQVGRELGKHYLRRELEGRSSEVVSKLGYDGSIVIVAATDAPIDARNLRRVASRAMLGMARTGGISANESGDYVIAFSTCAESQPVDEKKERTVRLLSNDAMSPLFLSVVEATEEAILNSLFCATSVEGRSGHVAEALPIDETVDILRKYNALREPPT